MYVSMRATMQKSKESGSILIGVVFLYPGLVCANGTERRVRPHQCVSELPEVGSFCVTCPAGSPVLGSGNTCPPS